ncbi:hypothetical protein M409DRAFT_18419 [Zasmidium cellare ATCC 36951]|uniref:Uncharacterized protein n=1 Tax=Zasmidium cellare ATCC 36951 TaxID=1080233 RepID=A0A6A6D0Y4_ZASCE|nr:uncharacterized protein M409DRAFT_18419 [Zasmidium cellare ATCC 36951]KAF2171306.1 hypothetical protein M409DRAFT_18419 [Zasmidium cellare ATCC 36951]
MATTVVEGLSAEHKAKLHEIADLMLQIYETLAEMCYVESAGIIRGPHNITSEMQQQYKELDLDPAIIYLYSILPYIDSKAANADQFFQRSHFFNHMKPSENAQGRDPWFRDPLRGNPNVGFDDANGLYMRPWYTPLSSIWERSPVIIYDAREHRIWIANYETSTDPIFYRRWYGELEEEQKSDWGGTDDYSDWSEKDEDEDGGDDAAASAGSSEFWDDGEEEDLSGELTGLSLDETPDVDFDEGFEIVEEIPWGEQVRALQIKNENSLELIQRRDAAEVLRDINSWYRQLKELPGDLGDNLRVEEKTKRSLYKKHGWPDTFDADAFMVDVIRTSAAERVPSHDVERDPANIIKKCQKRLEWSRRFRSKFTKPVDEAQGLDEEWTARFKLFRFDLGVEQHERDINEAEQELARDPTGDKRSDEELASLMVYEHLREQAGARRVRAEQWADTLSNAMDESDENRRYWEILASHLNRLMPCYEKALVEARADAQRVSPAKFAQPALMFRIDSEKASLASSMEELRRMEEFLETIPKDAVKAREEVIGDVKRREEFIQSRQAGIAELDESLRNDEY